MDDVSVQSIGSLSCQDLAALVARGRITTVDVVFPDLYGRLVGKHLDATFFVEHALVNGIHACDYLLAADIDMTPVAGYRFAHWERGYGDLHLVPDESTLTVAKWKARTALILCDVFDATTGAPVALAPRTLLRSELRRWRDLGLRPLAASELEFYVYGDTYQSAADKGYRHLTRADRHLQDYRTGLQSHERFFESVRRHLAASGIAVEGSKGEWGIGQHEVNLRPADALVMADRHTILKHCLKDLAAGHQISVTFMAKPDADGAGSSGHLHVSVWRGPENLCAMNDGSGPMPDELRWMLGGLIGCAADLMVLYAPTVNAYKRFRRGSWAPTNIGWARDNRTAAYRVVGCGPAGRIESRLPGADCNAYLAYAAFLTSARLGIERHIEPSDAVSGNAYESAGLEPLPRSLAEALERFRSSDVARDALGGRTHEHYVRFFEAEQEAFMQAVTDWERVRYFERI